MSVCKVSVIMPVYKVEKYVRKRLKDSDIKLKRI